MSSNAYAKSLSDRKYQAKIVLAKKGKGAYRRNDKYKTKEDRHA